MNEFDDSPFDYEYLLKELGSEATVERILKKYSQHTSTQLDKLSMAINSCRTEEIHRISHSIKGGALNIRAKGLMEKARHLEKSAMRKELDNALSEYNQIEHQFSVIKKYITSLYEEKRV